ncbi:acetyltransferase (GNAT) domain protein [Coriobacteriaceae bacterium BV3Ac1]|nr:acetyltransferase (GNAT) domain protein [Coriobacteriaceae bacterium BV3Ac1]
MIREVHVYGQAVRLGQADVATQHKGLGRQLVECACDIARSAGYDSINVISSVGTRAYYRRLGFEDAGLYQRRKLIAD